MRGTVPEPPSTYYWGRVYGCFFDDAAGLAAIDAIGPDQVTFETDYPHADGTWPHSKAVAERLLAGHSDELVRKIIRDNASRMLGLCAEAAQRPGGSSGVAPVGARRQPPAAQLPPSTWTVTPVTKRARSLARKATTAAASSGSPIAPSGGSTVGS